MEWKDEKKLMVYCINTDEQRLRDYFTLFGYVSQAVVDRNKATGKHMGSGFVIFADPYILETVVQYQHYIDGNKVEVRRALSREQPNTSTSRKISINARNSRSDGNTKKSKIFITGFQPTVTKEQFGQYFQAYGTVSDILLICDQQTEQSECCGFGFISFESRDAIDNVFQKKIHKINGTWVEVKRVISKYTNNNGFDLREDGSVTGGEDGGALPRNLFDNGNIISTQKVYKIFLGGLPHTMTEEAIHEYFQIYGNITGVELVRAQKNPQRNRGYGYIYFGLEDEAKKVLEKTFHDLNGKLVEVKRMFPEDSNTSEGESCIIGNGRTKKIFVGGLSRKVTEECFRKYFEAFGIVTEAILMYDQRTQKRPRGFGFIIFQSEDTVYRVLHKKIHEIAGKQVEIKRAYPKDKNSTSIP